MLTLINILLLSATIEGNITYESYDDLYRFPDRSTVCEARSFNINFQNNVRARYTGHAQDDRFLDTIIEEAQTLYEVWDTLDNAQYPYYSDEIRLQNLKKVHLLLGEEAWQRGLMPPIVPIWRFKNID